MELQRAKQTYMLLSTSRQFRATRPRDHGLYNILDVHYSSTVLYLDIDGVEGHSRLGVQHHKACDDISSIVERFVDMNVNLRLAAGLAHLARALFASGRRCTASDMKRVTIYE
jgi:hypothetical protein